MAEDDEFEPRLGRMRSGGGKRTRRYLGRVLAAANLARGGVRNVRPGSGFAGSRNGRGAGTGRLLARRVAGGRRVVVKASIVKLAGKGAGAAAAHLRYLQRDGVTPDGQPGLLYDRDRDEAEGQAFRDRWQGDRHQFRFIVSAEDGDQYDDLKPLTRRLMAQMEIDLGTQLDWMAVDHFNTAHPHTHILVRGVDDRGRDLVIARDYLTAGIRERARELVELDLGPPTEREIAARLKREVDQQRLTSIDRDLLRDADDRHVVTIAAADPVAQSLRAGRLAKLARLGLAEPEEGGRYRLAHDLDETLRRMGERGDIIRTMQRAIGERGIDKAAADQVIFDPAIDRSALVGRVMMRGLADEHADRHFMIIDGLDGRSHYVDIGKGSRTEGIADGAVVKVSGLAASAREVDRTIMGIAAGNRGGYDVDAHLRHDPSASEAYAETHVRRLEALRRGGVAVERSAAGGWRIPADYLAQVERYEAARLRDRPVAISILSSQPVDALLGADAATWLDRELVSEAPLALRDAGFGREVALAQDLRRQWLVAQGLAEVEDGTVRYRRGLLAALQRGELLRVAEGLAREFDRPFAEALPGERVEGKYRRGVDLVSGRFAVIERAHDFTLVPWRPALEHAIGKPVSGIVREAGTNWTIGRGRSGPTIA